MYMKRRIALFLIAVMLVSSLFSVFSLAEEEETATPELEKPAITYANVNYVNSISLMFAVPVPESLPEGATLSIILWEDPLGISSCGYNDVESTLAITLDHGGKTATIDGVLHYVFEYNRLTAEMMTDIVYVRPIIRLADGSRIYGDMINYSIVEYAMGAKGEIDGIDPITDPDVLELIDTMLRFGGMAQNYTGGEEGYLPNCYLASDDLAKLMIIPSYDGKEGEAVVGGFFTKGEETYATLSPIYDDYYTVVGWFDADGEEIFDQDSDNDNGIQLAVNSETDVTVTLKLERKNLISTDANAYENFKFTSLEINKNDTQKNMGDFSFNPSYSYTGKPDAVAGYQKDLGHHAFELMDDPYNPGEKVYKWTASTLSAIYFTRSGATLPMKDGFTGFGDTVDTSITIEVELGRNENGECIKTGIFRIRSDYEKTQVNFAVFGVTANGEVVLAKNGDITAKKGVVIGTLPETGYGRYAITVDFNDGTMKGYAENENGEMVYVGQSTMYNPNYNTFNSQGVEGYTSYRDWALNAQKKFEWFGEKNPLSATEQAELADLDGDGVGETPLKYADGVINEGALAYLTEKHNSMLIKYVGIFAGMIYE